MIFAEQQLVIKSHLKVFNYVLFGNFTELELLFSLLKHDVLVNLCFH